MNATIYQDESRTLKQAGTSGATLQVANAKGTREVSLVRAEVETDLPADIRAALTQRGEATANWFALVRDGQVQVVLPHAARAAVEHALAEVSRSEEEREAGLAKMRAAAAAREARAQEMDDLYNEGGEGYNPRRGPRTIIPGDPEHKDDI
jgi:membrane protein involved in colicin uptake